MANVEIFSPWEDNTSGPFLKLHLSYFKDYA